MGRIRQALLRAGGRLLTKPRGRYQRFQPNNLVKLRRLIRKGDIVELTTQTLNLNARVVRSGLWFRRSSTQQFLPAAIPRKESAK